MEATVELAMGESAIMEVEMAGPKLAAEETTGPNLAMEGTAATAGLKTVVVAEREIAEVEVEVEVAKHW